METTSISKLKNIKPNSNINIIGPVCSGKSTLINILACLFRGEGTIEIDGQNINNLDLDHLRKQVRGRC